MLEGIFGIIALACGLYCLYGFLMMKTKKEINRTILLPKDVDVNKCEDTDAYCNEAQWPLFALGVATTLYGVVDLLNTYIGGLDFIFVMVLILFFGVLVTYAVLVRKINQKYFGI